MTLINIITEEIKKFLIESDDNNDWDLYEKLDDVKRDILYDFLNNKKRGIKEQPWQLVPFLRLKKIWEDYMRTGVVRDTKGLDMIDEIIQDNIIKLYVNTELVGHTSVNPDEDFEDAGFTEQDKEDFYDYIDKFSDYAFSDFGGRRLGLFTLLLQLRKAKTPEEKLVLIDQILNVIHMSSDLASYFVEGGSNALSQLSGTPSQPISEYLNEQQNIENNINNNFRKWFGNSKVIDKSGKPLVVYHGSRSDFDEFFGDTYFTDDYMNADGYASGEYIYEVYLNMKRPLIVDCQDKKWDDIETPYGTTTQGVVGNIDRNKYDGVIFINIKDSWIDDVDYQDAGTIYTTFSPTQIKSIHNDGTWDIGDKNIYS